MKLSAAMTGITPSTSFAGEVSGDDYILALDCSTDGSATSPADYDVATVHVSNYGAELSPETDSSQFYYEGYTSMKKSTSRKFKPVGKRLMGDAFQDFICSHAIKYGKGSAVVILVNNDGAAESGAIGDIDAELQVIGVPEEYTYSAT